MRNSPLSKATMALTQASISKILWLAQSTDTLPWVYHRQIWVTIRISPRILVSMALGNLTPHTCDSL